MPRKRNAEDSRSPLDGQDLFADSLKRTLFESGVEVSRAEQARWMDSIRRYQGDGGPVDIAFLRPPGDPSPDARHRTAAVAGMRMLAARQDFYSEALVKADGTQRSDHFSITLDESRMQGEEISVRGFLGGGYDFSKRACTGTIDSLMNLSEEHQSLVYAFCTSPHGVENYPEHLTWLLGDVFGWFGGSSEIYRWNADWSNYFDAGREWWGTFFWTVHVKSRGLFVALGASTTD